MRAASPVRPMASQSCAVFRSASPDVVARSMCRSSRKRSAMSPRVASWSSILEVKHQPPTLDLRGHSFSDQGIRLWITAGFARPVEERSAQPSPKSFEQELR